MFKKGVSGNPTGRPKGSTSRHKLTESMLAKFSEDEVFEVLSSLRKAAIDGEVGAAKTFLEFFMVKADKMAEIEAQNQEDEPIESLRIMFGYQHKDGSITDCKDMAEYNALEAKEEKSGL